LDVVNVVGIDAFLEALDDQSLRIHILHKSPLTMDEALRIALNLEALHCTMLRLDFLDFYYRHPT